MASFDEFYKSLPQGSDQESSRKRGEYFEKVFIPWFLKKDPVWASKVSQVWLWEDYPKRWGRDCGIDLVYEDLEGKHWAVQCKCISPNNDIPKKDIDSFLSESNDPRIYGRVLIASTDGMSKNAEQVLERQEKQVVRFMLDDFRKSWVDFPSSLEDISTGRRKEKYTPKPHQNEAIKNVIEGFQKEDRGQLLMACGTGKTLTSLWIKEALNAKWTLVLVPSLGLLSQTLRKWIEHSENKLNWICVCSDKSVAKQDKTTDNMVERVSGLGVPVTSDPKDIQDFLENENGGVVFSTYQSSELVADSHKNPSTPGFDITFADEAHRCTGKVSSAFACVLDRERIRSDKRLFMTATPRVLSKQIKKKADEENINLACMDNVSQFGEVFHQLDFSEAIETELLSDYKVVIVGVDDPSVEAKIIDRMIVDTGNECTIDTETLANHIALAKAIKDYDLRRMITFHGRVKSAKKFSEDHPLILDWMPEESKSSKSTMTSYVSGEMNAKTRNTEINKLRNISEQQVGILANARCLSEGVDIPTLDGIAFFNPRSSQVDIIQAVGRAIRKSENKTDGYIILPVYLGDTTNVKDEILQSRFKDIWNVILALKSQDNLLRETLDQLRIDLGRRNSTDKSGKGLSKIIFALPSRISTAFSDSLTTILVRETTDNWMERYGQLKEYIEINSDALVPQNHPTLGKWVLNNRNEYKKKKISKDRINLLNKIGFIWDCLEHEWQNRYQELKQYVEQNGDALVPQSHPILGSWIGSQRNSRKAGKLSDDRIKLLNEIGFIWDPFEHEWQIRYQELRQYVEQNGDALVPRSHPTLGLWVKQQRSAYNNSKLSTERIKRLNIIGFSWDPIEQEWQIRYQELKQYIEQNGDALVPISHPTLGSWIGSQRNSRKAGKLSDDRIKLLDAIGFLWDPHEEKWQKQYRELKKYIKDNGNHLVPSDNPIIGRWVVKQRSMYSQGKLSQNRIKLLNEIGFIWDLDEHAWQLKYKELKLYIEKNGDALVRRSHPTLGRWTLHQRNLYNLKKLPDKHFLLLEEIGFIWNPRDHEWRANFRLYNQYIKETGNTWIATSHPTLGNWVHVQRRSKSNGTLSQEYIQLLNEVGFVWNRLDK